ncbi:MAG: PaaI family thioesterase [Solirubrobacteraceae bacterium]
MAVPDLFQPLEPSPFGELVGPVFIRRSDSVPVLGVRVGPQHSNRQGRAHGGLLMTLADIAVSRAAAATVPPGGTIATAALQISFLESVGEGEWLEAVPRIDRLGRSLIHASCVVQAGDNVVARVLATIAVRLPVPE